MPRETLSEPQAHACLALVKKHFAPYLDPERGCVPHVRLVDADPAIGRRLHWQIVWESGSPYEWAYLATSGGVDEEMDAMLAEFGGTAKPMEPITWPDGVNVECESSFILSLYPA